ncbi:MAG TPA: hypothetical protein VHL50_08060 [Pyrinomonadaceae bacterium]|jgi:hypothetical protein|nr:hypothetical protein [Pyrinomonadaceae bacterium]
MMDEAVVREQQMLYCSLSTDGLKKVYILIISNEWLEATDAESLISRFRSMHPTAAPEMVELARANESEELLDWVWRLNGRLAAVRPEYRKWIELPF